MPGIICSGRDSFIKRLLLIVIVALLNSYSSSGFAKSFSGTMNSVGNGNYLLHLNDDEGNIYTGNAIDVGGNNILDVTVKNDNDDGTYSGTAINLGDDNYSLDLTNGMTNENADGIVMLENPEHVTTCVNDFSCSAKIIKLWSFCR